MVEMVMTVDMVVELYLIVLIAHLHQRSSSYTPEALLDLADQLACEPSCTLYTAHPSHVEAKYFSQAQPKYKPTTPCETKHTIVAEGC